MEPEERAAAEPSGYYTSKYSGEEIDALLDSVASLKQAVAAMAAAQGVSLEQGV